MGRTKQPTAPPEAPTETEIENQSLELASSSLEEQARQRLSPDTIKKLKKIAYFTGKVGLPLQEACMLVDVDYFVFEEQMKLEPLIKRIIEIKELEFKKDMLHVLAAKARTGDVSLAQWFLEKKFPNEYGNKKGPAGPGDGEDLMLEAIRIIRRSGDQVPLVSDQPHSHSIVVPNHPSTLPSAFGRPFNERIDDILASPVVYVPTVNGEPHKGGK